MDSEATASNFTCNTASDTPSTEVQGDVAVVVCTYRRPDRLGRAVREVLDQRQFRGQSVIVVEDGSDDGGRTEGAIRALQEEVGDRLVVIRHGVNRGVAAARTTGVAEAINLGAEAVCFHDDDDHWDPRRLAQGFRPLADPGVAMTFAEQRRIDDSFLRTGALNVTWAAPARSYRGTLIDGLMRGRLYFPFQTALFRTSLCRELLPFMAVRESEDLDFALRALKLIRASPGLREVHIPEVLAYHVASADSLSFTEENNRIREGVHREIFGQHVPRPLVELMFALSKRVIRPAGIALGRARGL